MDKREDYSQTDRSELAHVCDINISLIRDPAYPLLPRIMKAYPVDVATTPAQRHFNPPTEQGAMCIENASGCLKGRRWCLRTAMENDTAMVPTIDPFCSTVFSLSL